MVVAAFVVSLAALLLAGASAFYTKQQSESAGKVAAIEERRHHDERTPTFTAEARMADEHNWIVPVIVTNTGPVTWDDCLVTQVPVHPEADEAVRGFWHGDTREIRNRGDVQTPVYVGASFTLPVMVSDNQWRGERGQFLFWIKGEGDDWVLPKDVIFRLGPGVY